MPYETRSSSDYEPNHPPDHAGFVAHWQRIWPRLEEIRARELAEMTDEERWQAIDRVLELSDQFRTKRPLTGLIELQRFFMKVWGDERGSLKPPLSCRFFQKAANAAFASSVTLL